ncbi:PilW family protein [Pyxidicoccus sp. 3LG]
MKRSFVPHRGFTLLEVMISSVIGVIVLAVGLAVSLQMQRRALLEEQTMQAQVVGRTVKDLIATDLQRAGSGMGNAPITFADGDLRHAIQVWTEPDLSVEHAPFFAADPTFSPAPAGTPYAGYTSDVLQLYWGDTRGMVVLAGCAGGNTTVRMADATTFCTAPNPPVTLNPIAGATPTVIVNPKQNLACRAELTQVDPGTRRITATPGTAGAPINNGLCGPQAAPVAGVWSARTGPEWEPWSVLRFQGGAYRVNWQTGTPTLQYLPPGGGAWVTVSEDVERMKVRQAVIDLADPNEDYRWFPDPAQGRLLAIDQCAIGTCTVDPDPAPAGAPDNDAELRAMLRQRVREVEVTLTIRTQRQDREVVESTPPNVTDEEDFPVDGYKRRTLTFRVTPRNFVMAGRQPDLGAGGVGP